MYMYIYLYIYHATTYISINIKYILKYGRLQIMVTNNHLYTKDTYKNYKVLSHYKLRRKSLDTIYNSLLWSTSYISNPRVIHMIVGLTDATTFSIEKLNRRLKAKFKSSRTSTFIFI